MLTFARVVSSLIGSRRPVCPFVCLSVRPPIGSSRLLILSPSLQSSKQNLVGIPKQTDTPEPYAGKTMLGTHLRDCVDSRLKITWLSLIQGLIPFLCDKAGVMGWPGGVGPWEGL